MREVCAAEGLPQGPAHAFLAALAADSKLMHLGDIDRKIKNHQALTLEEAAMGMIYVLTASNNRFREEYRSAIADAYTLNADGTRRPPSPQNDHAFVARGMIFLQGMAMREALYDLTPEEIAGLAIGGLADGVIQLSLGSVVETCGMGGDKGFDGAKFAGTKTINASTLSAVVLASMGVKTFKHGSGPTTAALGSTQAAEMLGLPTKFASGAAMQNYFDALGFVYLEAGLKTLHDLSTLTKLETINHLVGPMTPPVTADTTIHKVIGVNHHVHPESVVQAYNLLHQRGIQSMGGIIGVCGLSEDAVGVSPADAYSYAILDELSPFSTLLSLGNADEFYGSVVVTPADFGVTGLTAENIQVVNEATVVKEANRAALNGSNPVLADYLAMNAALGLLASHGLSAQLVTDRAFLRSELQHAFWHCRRAISDGLPERFLAKVAAYNE